MTTTGPGPAPFNQDGDKTVLRSLLRRLSLILSDCRRRGNTRRRYRMDAESLVESLLNELDERECAPAVMRRLRKVHHDIHVNGLTRDSCQEMELLLCQLRRYEKTVADSDVVNPWLEPPPHPDEDPSPDAFF